MKKIALTATLASLLIVATSPVQAVTEEQAMVSGVALACTAFYVGQGDERKAETTGRIADSQGLTESQQRQALIQASDHMSTLPASEINEVCQNIISVYG
ncbi:hypothetical protein [Vibrio sp. ER1A]|uniref:hypothetical protein n=1 Tax=Vibrio sp. ER1A TaxID=1517681 RepID=UPI0004DD5FBB|nr:hypothetical protein [Vibrio sp. ER1A]KFA99313.1 hypothetical protein HW45_04455 [Vibrio sp. ER1A]